MESNTISNAPTMIGRTDAFVKTTEVLVHRHTLSPEHAGSDRAHESDDECLVVDSRWELSPAEVVENKLARKLRDATIPVSHMQSRCLLRER